MREIKFRGKHLHSGKWLFGYYLYRFCAEIWTPSGTRPVDGKTLGQFTGLKDINGVEIYEGDIIKQQNFNGEEYTAIYQVCYNLGSFCLQLVKGNANAMKDSGYSSWSFELYAEDKGKIRKGQVIGNIHDNPELLN